MDSTKKPDKRLPIIIGFIMLLISVVIFVATTYKNVYFGDIGIDGIIFTLFGGNEGTTTDSLLPSIIKYSFLLILFYLILISPILVARKYEIKTKKNKIIRLLLFLKSHFLKYSIIIFCLAITYIGISLQIPQFISYKLNNSSFFDNNYVNPSSVKLTFPEKKRNLIRIYLESVENTILSKENGGSSNKSLAPELENLATDKSNISFSNTSKLGGIEETYGATWTAAGMVAQSAGVPILNAFSIGQNDFGYLNSFLPGSYSIGQTLQNAGYYQELILGSDANFGGRSKYFTQHGDYNIFDYNTAIKKGKISSDYHVWWGFEDKKLFEYSKEEILSAAKSDKPFDVQILTADTHFTDGYLDETCATDFDSHYKNVFACSSKQVNAFIKWIKQQDFYNNTTIVITGDHLGMQTDFYRELTKDNNNYKRTVYDVIINSAKTTENEKNRSFSSFDMLPTTLSSLGVDIEGNQLSLGVDLFSNTKTLFEKYGQNYVNSELMKKSNYYNNNILSTK